MYGDTLLRSQFGKPSGWFGALFMGPILNLSNTRLVNAAVALLDPRPKDAILDIGFGGGLSLVSLAARAPQAKIVGVDYSREMVEAASRMLRDKKLQARVLVKWGDVAKNKTAAAISSPVPFRRIGVCLAIRRIKGFAAFSPKSIIPGATQFTAISGASAFAITLVSICTAAFDEQ